MRYFLFLLAFTSLLFFACGSQSGKPPQLVKTNYGTISPFDTVTVGFDSDVKVAELEKYTSDQKVKILYDKSKTYNSKIRFVGIYDTTTGENPISYFKPGTAHVINFPEVKNVDGYSSKNLSVSFNTLPSPYGKNKKNDEQDNAYKIDENEALLGGDLTKGIKFAGALDHKIPEKSNYYNDEDFYTLKLKQADSLIVSVTANTGEPIYIDLLTPTCHVVSKYNTGTQKSILYKDGGSYWMGCNPKVEPEDGALFYIRVYYNNSSFGKLSSPYSLSVRTVRGQLW